jgi:2-polyprenyl-3-methyl-5-hydroxy-6-metoxy-1,4-benzoquinol methylase
MGNLGFINRRVVTGERMDLPDVDAGDHREALEGLRRINAASRTAGRMAGPIGRLARREKLDRISLLDVACGGADVSIGVATAAKGWGATVALTLMDRSSTALQHAARAAARAGIGCRCIQGDALAALPGNDFDVVASSLFLHHVPTADQVVDLLRNMRGAAGRMVVISDLERSRAGLAAAWLGCRLLSRSEIVHHDGPASVRAAWRLGELAEFAARAGMGAARIGRCWPWRMLLIWERSGDGL